MALRASLSGVGACGMASTNCVPLGNRGLPHENRESARVCVWGGGGGRERERDLPPDKNGLSCESITVAFAMNSPPTGSIGTCAGKEISFQNDCEMSDNTKRLTVAARLCNKHSTLRFV